MSEIEVSIKGLDQALNKISSLNSPAQRKKILRVVSRQILKNSRKRTSQQSDLHGQSYKKHARGRKRKMLTRLTRAKNMNIITLSESSALIGFKNRYQETIAAKQQYGHTEKMSAEKMRQRAPSVNSNKPATRRQAKALLDAGYKRKIKGKSYKKPSIKFITQSMTIGQAGLILRVLRGSKDNWTTKLPPRSFLGVESSEIEQLGKLAIATMEQEMHKKYG